MGGPAAVTIVVHGHFYQPPRENPWTEEVAREPSAAPFHDWNERITAESYRPNGAARVVDERNLVVAIVDNYELLSMNAGPTLLAWLERHEREVYARMTGARGAIAQAFSHLILPLASERDVRTQVRWGLADFRHRFGRPAAGMWLPECAVDEAVLAVLAEEGVGCTILAPGQATAVRPLDDAEAEWIDVSDGGLDTRRTYRWVHPDGSGRGVDILFYDGGLSHDVAFALGMLSSAGLIDRMVAAGGEDGGIVSVATDGETFGHHHRWGERAVAYALGIEAPRRGLVVSDLVTAVRANPPQDEVAVRESAWSCVHGVGRWREDCGCSTGGQPGWNQAWRAPLRKALDYLRADAAEVFERRGKEVMADLWAARDAYIDVVIGARSQADFLAEHVRGDEVVALTLLEAERCAMAMYTSCGWFFNDLAGLETVQILRYAARVLDLLGELGEAGSEEGFLDLLAEAQSNDPEEGSGVDIWVAHVLPSRVTPARVAAHLALTSLLARQRPAPRVGVWDVEIVDHSRTDRAGLALCTGIVRIADRRTRRSERIAYGAVHLAGLEVFGATRPYEDIAEVDRELWLLRENFAGGVPVTQILARVGMFGSEQFGLDAALPDAVEALLAGSANALAERFGLALEQLVDDHRAALDTLAAAGVPLPALVRGTAELALARRIEAEARRHAGSTSPSDWTDVIDLVSGPLPAGLDLDRPEARRLISGLLSSSVERAVAAPEDSAEAAQAARFAVDGLRVVAHLGIRPDIEPAQERAYHALLAHDRPDLAELALALGLAHEALGRPS